MSVQPPGLLQGVQGTWSPQPQPGRAPLPTSTVSVNGLHAQPCSPAGTCKLLAWIKRAAPVAAAEAAATTHDALAAWSMGPPGGRGGAWGGVPASVDVWALVPDVGWVTCWQAMSTSVVLGFVSGHVAVRGAVGVRWLRIRGVSMCLRWV